MSRRKEGSEIGLNWGAAKSSSTIMLKREICLRVVLNRLLAKKRFQATLHPPNSRHILPWLRNRCSGGKFVVSRTGEAYTPQAIGLNRTLRLIIHEFGLAIGSTYRDKTFWREESHMLSTLRSAIFICATLVVFSALCVEATVPAAPQESDAVVKMTPERKFMPEKITIKAGQTVEWVNDDNTMPHEVTTDPNVASDPSNVSIPAEAAPFDSHLITSGKSFRHQFTVPGLYRYACPPHENDGMLGEVTVSK
jgi:plastocyanin